MNIRIAAVFIFILFLFSSAKELLAIDTAAYQKLLDRHLEEKATVDGISVNVIDYRSLVREREDPDSNYNRLLGSVARSDPVRLPTRGDKIAFWINAYNIGTVELILRHYPVKSIRSMKINMFTFPFNKKVLTVNGTKYSLYEIEYGILLGRLKMLETHFGINCASVSCADVAPEVYTGANLDSLLKKQASLFLSDRDKGLRIDREKGIVYLSRIFKYDSKNFGKGKSVIIPFILQFVEDEKDRQYLEKGKYRIRFMKYNWKLNDRRFTD